MTGEDKEFIRVKECRVEKFGLSGTPVAQQGAYTQTYNTADKTISNPTAVAVGDLGNGANGASSTGNFDKIEVAIDALIVDNLDLRKAVTALIDDLQALGLVG